MEKRIFATKSEDGIKIKFIKYGLSWTSYSGSTGYNWHNVVSPPPNSAIKSIELFNFNSAEGLFRVDVTLINDEVKAYLVEWNDGVY